MHTCPHCQANYTNPDAAALHEKHCIVAGRSNTQPPPTGSGNMPVLHPSNAPQGQSQVNQILDALEACGLPFAVTQESNGTWWADGHHGRTLRDALAQLAQVRLLRGLDKRTRKGVVVLPYEMTETLKHRRVLQRQYDFVIDESALQALEQVRR